MLMLLLLLLLRIRIRLLLLLQLNMRRMDWFIVFVGMCLEIYMILVGRCMQLYIGSGLEVHRAVGVPEREVYAVIHRLWIGGI